jgi:hypothetical protein
MNNITSNAATLRDRYSGMQVSGWVTSTQTPEGVTLFGPFGSQEEAIAWSKKLTSAEVYRVFRPSTNAG